jgi:hypothetical protein
VEENEHGSRVWRRLVPLVHNRPESVEPVGWSGPYPWMPVLPGLVMRSGRLRENLPQAPTPPSASRSVARIARHLQDARHVD